MLHNNRYAKSHSLLDRALKTIPLASQTFSKSHIQFPENHAPLFVEEARGARFRDVDGNEFVDLMMALAPVTLGYQDKDVDDAIRGQLEKGICFSMPSPLEMEVAEKIVEIIPCAEMVRYGKAGSDATSAAIRLARAFTGRDRIISLGYHGWHDWYIGATARNMGVPKPVCDLTHALAYNNLDALHDAFSQYPGEIAAIIMEPMSAAKPQDGYLAAVKELAHKNGALLVFDEVVTGFRYALGGAQAHFGVTPDLAAFGKGIANGMPLSVITGRADVMRVMEDIFFSGTFGGEALSLAAANAVIDKMRKEPVIDHLWSMGAALQAGIKDQLSAYALSEAFMLMGSDCLGFVVAKDYQGIPAAAIRTFYLKNMLDNGVMTNGSLTVSYAFGEGERAFALEAFDKTFAGLRAAFDSRDFYAAMDCKTIEPVFQVRKAG